MLCIFIWPAEREQYDLRRFARDLDGFFSVTAVFNLLPGFARRYAATPFWVIPAPDLVERKFFLLRGGILAFLRSATTSHSHFECK
jgi:hypothetical protein